MPPEGLAAISAISFAASHVVSKRGLRATSVTAGFLAIVAVAWLVVAAAVLFDLPSAPSIWSVGLFAVSGLFAPAVARAAALMGVDKLGPSVAVPIQQGLRPLLVLPAAALLLGEGIGLLRIVGVVAIVAGGWILSRRPADAAVDVSVGTVGPVATEPAQRRGALASALRSSRGFRPGIVYPVAAAISYAAADVIVKRALELYPHPAFGAMVSIGTGLAVWGLAHVWRPVRRHLRVGSDVGWLAVSGALMGAAILLLFNALQLGDVSVVAPIVATQPLFVFLFSVLILRDQERLYRSTVVAGVVVVLGTVLVSG